MEAILRWNSGIRNPDKLSAGQRLIIPPATLDFRALSNGKGRNRHILDALRQGGVMYSTSFYPAYAQAMVYACTMFSCRSFDRERFHDAYEEEFKGDVIKQEHVDGLNKLLGFIEHDPDMTNLKVTAYLLATIHHETSWPKTNERYTPITERGNGGKVGMTMGARYGLFLALIVCVTACNADNSPAEPKKATVGNNAFIRYIPQGWILQE